jgi:hypothetical protein
MTTYNTQYTIDKRIAQTLQDELVALWEGKGSLIGSSDRTTIYAINISKGVFGGKTARFTVEINTIDQATGKAETEQERQWKMYAPMRSNGVLKDTDLGRTFVRTTDEFTIVGWNNKNRKYPVLAQSGRSGTTYKFPLWYLPGMPNAISRWKDEDENISDLAAETSEGLTVGEMPPGGDFLASLEALRSAFDVV